MHITIRVYRGYDPYHVSDAHYVPFSSICPSAWIWLIFGDVIPTTPASKNTKGFPLFSSPSQDNQKTTKKKIFFK
jgi:hypothetical protein